MLEFGVGDNSNDDSEDGTVPLTSSIVSMSMSSTGEALLFWATGVACIDDSGELESATIALFESGRSLTSGAACTVKMSSWTSEGTSVSEVSIQSLLLNLPFAWVFALGALDSLLVYLV